MVIIIIIFLIDAFLVRNRVYYSLDENYPYIGIRHRADVAYATGPAPSGAPRFGTNKCLCLQVTTAGP